MKNKIYCLLILFAFSYSLQAQLNKYKYIIVPKNFVGLKYENQYKTSTLIKYLFEQKGFDAVYDDNLPQDFNSNRCLGLLVQLNHKSTMFTTIASLTLNDCNDKDVFVTAEGKSKLKDHALAYKEAIESAFNSFNNVSYKYKPAAPNTTEPMPVVVKNEVKAPQEVQVAEQEKDLPNSKSNISQADEVIVPEKTTTAVVATIAEESGVSKVKGPEVWYAQQIPNGYQMVDSTPKIRLKIYKTSLPNIYIGVNGEVKGLVYSKNSKWYFEYYIADELQTQELTIKF